jgi:UDPglucose 6-dehydrogenase/GDP-mannose 6-dehydrogenase
VDISIIGTGYVGLVTGTCLASAGHNVTCVDTDPNIVTQVSDGRAPIHETGLDELLGRVTASGNLRPTTDTRAAVLQSDVTLICVGTPNDSSGVDVSQIVSAAESIGKALAEKDRYHVVAVKSTVPPGTTEAQVRQTIEASSSRRLGKDWGLCMNPEFLRQGCAVDDFRSADRVVIGASDGRAAKSLLEVYSHVPCPKIVTSIRTAEMIKYVSNALFATLISFSNEIANVCAATADIDAREIWKGVHLDRRLTANAGDQGSLGVTDYLWHGLGFGGSCFPKDLWALRKFSQHLNVPTPIMDAVIATNRAQPLQIVSLIEREMDVARRRIAVLGLAFKPGTDDLRESPALPVIAALNERGAYVIAHDPIAMPRARQHPALKAVSFARDWQSALKGADACCVVTAWPEYGGICPEDFLRLMRQPLVVDGRGLFDARRLMAAGVTWRGIGFTPSVAANRH